MMKRRQIEVLNSCEKLSITLCLQKLVLSGFKVSFVNIKGHIFMSRGTSQLLLFMNSTPKL